MKKRTIKQKNKINSTILQGKTKIKDYISNIQTAKGNIIT